MGSKTSKEEEEDPGSVPLDDGMLLTPMFESSEPCGESVGSPSSSPRFGEGFVRASGVGPEPGASSVSTALNEISPSSSPSSATPSDSVLSSPWLTTTSVSGSADAAAEGFVSDPSTSIFGVPSATVPALRSRRLPQHRVPPHRPTHCSPPPSQPFLPTGLPQARALDMWVRSRL
jgi:hypothetical protein